MSNRLLNRDAWMAGGSFGDTLQELLRDKHISQAQFAHGVRFLTDLQRWHGSSAGIVNAVLAERVDISLNVAAIDGPPGGGDSEAFNRVEYTLRTLRDHERLQLHWLVTRKEYRRGGLADLGRMLSTYKTNKTTKAVAIGRIGALLDSIGEIYASILPVPYLSSDMRRSRDTCGTKILRGLDGQAHRGLPIRASPT